MDLLARVLFRKQLTRIARVQTVGSAYKLRTVEVSLLFGVRHFFMK